MESPAYHLRRCITNDAAMLSLVAGASLLEAFAGILTGIDLLQHCQRNNSPEAFAKYLAQATTRCILAEAEPGDAPVGYIVCCEPDLPVDLLPTDYELRRIYLLHRFQGLGIGRALMNAAIQAAEELGRRRLLLGVYGENHDAIRFYQKAGFTRIGERFFTVGTTTHHDAVMALPL
ncbi:MAG: GNAT family N-acetyltransferase [Janthinobacterium lividum]